jgi:antitoxin CptB
MENLAPSDYLKKLRWRSRRGMKEMDLMLLRYLDQASIQNDSAKLRQYEALLELEDDLLWRGLMGHRIDCQPNQQQLLTAIRQLNGL